MKAKHFLTAKKASLWSDHPAYKLGAVVAKCNRVLSEGWNQYKTHPDSPHPFKHVHAEILALTRAGRLAKGADLYVYREGKDGVLRMSRPCKSCMAAIKAAGIKRIYYTNFGYSCELLYGR